MGETQKAHITSCYSNCCTVTGARLNASILSKELTIKGFVTYNHIPRWPEAFKAMGEWIDKVNDGYIRGSVYRAIYLWTGLI